MTNGFKDIIIVSMFGIKRYTADLGRQTLNMKIIVQETPSNVRMATCKDG